MESDFFSNSEFGSESSESSSKSLSYGFIDENICGEGASCIVYHMRCDGLHVAVKRLRPEFRTHPAYLASYKKEYLIGRQLKHYALPVFRDFAEDTEDVYIVMDYIDGISIEDFILTDEGKEYFRSEKNVRRFFSELLSVIAYLHRSGVIHCDLKPANILLRHSDRGVMMIDLDKSYSDTLDRTHGGTPAASDPMIDGNKPTAQKDYAAIGRLLEILEESIPNFPKSKFRRFQRLCCKGDSTSEMLIDAIKTSSRFNFWLAGIGVVCLVVFAVLWSVHDRSEVSSSQTDSSGSVKDSVIVVKNIQDVSTPVKSIPVENESNKVKYLDVTIKDFDMRMSDFSHTVDKSMQSLCSGVISDKEIQELMNSVVDEYTSKYGELLSHYKDSNPDKSSLDVEMALAQVSEQSRASRLLKQFTQAVVDTLKNRHPERYDD